MKFDKLVESIIGKGWDWEDALANPKDFELHLDTLNTEDWDGNAVYNTIAFVYKNGESIASGKYERLDNSDDIDEMVSAFEKHNPEGIEDNRRYY
jgi:hypothetical protein